MAEEIVPRRRYARIPFWAEVRYRIVPRNGRTERFSVISKVHRLSPGGAFLKRGDGVDQSIEGIQFESADVVPVGAWLEVNLRMSDDAEESVIQGKVAWCDRWEGGEGFRVGVQFIGKNRTTMKAVETFIRKHFM